MDSTAPPRMQLLPPRREVKKRIWKKIVHLVSTASSCGRSRRVNPNGNKKMVSAATPRMQLLPPRREGVKKRIWEKIVHLVSTASSCGKSRRVYPSSGGYPGPNPGGNSPDGK